MGTLIPDSFDQLPLHKAKVEVAARVLMADTTVVGLAVGGSFATGAADDYSDVDLWIAVTDGELASIRSRAEATARACGKLIAQFPAEHLGDPDHLIVLYEDLVHVDFQYVDVSDFGRNVRGRACHVLWERNGELSSQLPGLVVAPDPQKDLAWMEDRVWVWLWYAQQKILRGELYEALSVITTIREWVLFRLLALRSGVDHAGARRVEGLMGSHGAAIVRTVPLLDPPSLMSATQALATTYAVLADPLLKQYGLPKSDARSAIEAALAVGLEWEPGS